MHRNDHPSAPGGVHTDGDPQRGIAPTTVTAALMNALQEELAHFIESRGIVLNKNDNTQLTMAILDAIGTTVASGDFVTHSEFQLHTQGGDPHQQYALESMLGDAAHMDVGTTGSTVAAGDHAHSQYELKSNLKQAAYKDVGTGADQVAAGNHSHTDIKAFARQLLWNGSSSNATFDRNGANLIFITLNHGGRGLVQVVADLDEAIRLGNIRWYNRGGENADRDYDIVLTVVAAGANITITAPASIPMYRVIGY